MTLRLYDARRGVVAPFEPPPAGPIGLYVCGVTPYDTGHLGHAFTYLSFDVLHRYLEYLGHQVRYVQNLTDVDDDMLRKARETGEDYLALGNRHVTTFLTEMAALNWLAPDEYPRATDHIPQMLAMIDALVQRGHAYAAEGNVYFSVASWPRYGELSGLPHEAMLPLANERGNRPDDARQARSARLRPLAGLAAGRAGVAGSVGRRPPRLAHRVLGDGDGVPRQPLRRSTAAVPTSSSRTTSRRSRRPRRPPASGRSSRAGCTPACFATRARR